jgi:hypothetical protein
MSVYFLLGCELPPNKLNPKFSEIDQIHIPIPINASPEEHDYYQHLNSDNYALTDRFGSLRTGISADAVISKLDKPTSSGKTNEITQLRSGFPGLWFQYFEDYELIVLYDQDEVTTGYLVGW